MEAWMISLIYNAKELSWPMQPVRDISDSQRKQEILRNES
jgi:hypothetical protein